MAGMETVYTLIRLLVKSSLIWVCSVSRHMSVPLPKFLRYYKNVQSNCTSQTRKLLAFCLHIQLKISKDMLSMNPLVSMGTER